MSAPTADHHFPFVVEVTDSLVHCFARPRLGNKHNPLNELLYVLLSSKTPPDRYQEVYRELRDRYRRAEELAEADPEQVATVIREAGLQNRKARAIVVIARRLREAFGRVTLAPVAAMSDEDAEQFLTGFPEIGKKTARCVLMYSLDRAVFPVDAHCFRIAKRLKWIPAECSLTDRVADALQNAIPEGLRKDLHLGMVLLGREYCVPRRPRCDQCPLLPYCPTGAKQRRL